ncbi:TetR/AcrR family transcriptional regulator [Rhodococcoides kyotonense]|uniref:HTH tetR-type domain-containing protein n=1 Tax=Rhodococcoides kyotonense TaxID=398843 RepID=A0A177Y8A6_9NOCA|nr:helix-turn-helix domain-containing protein [Rhodococcus kyotonensis]OAK51756.1 hypothetical protein A3K89_10815 [Rhodococcus kyotonensis]
MAESGRERPLTTVWERSYGTRGPAPAHSRDDVAAAAIELASESGLSAVSTRRIAQKLGVSQSALYRYVAGLDDVFDLMVDAAVAEIDLDVPLHGDAVGDLVALASRAKAVHVDKPWLLDVPIEALRIGPRGIDFLEYGVRALGVVDLPGPVKLQIIAVMNSLVQQFARAEVGEGAAHRGRLLAHAAYLHKTALAGNHPNLAAALADSDSDGTGPGEMFEPVMRRMLSGVLGLD